VIKPFCAVEAGYLSLSVSIITLLRATGSIMRTLSPLPLSVMFKPHFFVGSFVSQKLMKLRRPKGLRSLQIFPKSPVVPLCPYILRRIFGCRPLKVPLTGKSGEGGSFFPHPSSFGFEGRPILARLIPRPSEAIFPQYQRAPVISFFSSAADSVRFTSSFLL